MSPRPKHSRKSKQQSACSARKQSTKESRAAGRLFEDLLALQRRLLAQDGCPWDREQTHQSLRPFLIEEAYEVLDAMERGKPEKFAEELGDLLLQIVFHAQLAKQEGQFEISDVIRAVHAKMVRRHPHVFGAQKARSAAQVLKNWEHIKSEERRGESASNSGKAKQDSILGGVPRSLPALLEGYQLSRRAANIGFDWENVGGIFEKLDEEIAEVREAMKGKSELESEDHSKLEGELGDLLFAAVNLSRFLGVDPEIALKRSNQKFRARFQWMERKAQQWQRRLAEVPRHEMEALWDQSKISA